MSYSDDPNSSRASFSGDDFNQGDLLLQSPVTNERVVDTQSGFLVVVKKLGERLSLSCKRCVGTPPTSSILLTPDESVKLSRILATTLAGVPEPAEQEFAHERRRRFRLDRSGIKVDEETLSPNPLAISIAAVVGIALFAGAYFLGVNSGKQAAKSQAQVAHVDPLELVKVDSFCRNFVADMLDFNPNTYRASQIQAMSYMSPELLEKYWTETNFPLSGRQLKALPQGTTVIINKITQSRPDPQTVMAAISAELVRPGVKVSSPVQLKLKLVAGDNAQIRVIEQEDQTTSAGN